MFAYIKKFLSVLFYLTASMFAYGALMWAVGLIHPVAPGILILLAVAGFWSYFSVRSDRDTAAHEAEMAKIKARSDEATAKFRDNLKRFRADAEAALDRAKADQPMLLTRYTEDDWSDDTAP